MHLISIGDLVNLECVGSLKARIGRLPPSPGVCYPCPRTKHSTGRARLGLRPI
ncbi:hypothetical protein RESH_00570 [Rhodopirellula europaea SH398]|uniref:Uncharacterized protein n=1 Tax=Rhodopirellula europaea SH398 TaxID=1263868 RepID=M5SBL4_9BACT|nr:hypothetical protein RESH_00570 [Rhodopirellula europaea SH398]